MNYICLFAIIIDIHGNWGQIHTCVLYILLGAQQSQVGGFARSKKTNEAKNL